MSRQERREKRKTGFTAFSSLVRFASRPLCVCCFDVDDERILLLLLFFLLLSEISLSLYCSLLERKIRQGGNCRLSLRRLPECVCVLPFSSIRPPCLLLLVCWERDSFASLRCRRCRRPTFSLSFVPFVVPVFSSSIQVREAVYFCRVFFLRRLFSDLSSHTLISHSLNSHTHTHLSQEGELVCADFSRTDE